MKQFNEAKFIIDNEEHTIKVNSIGNDSVNLIIQSNPIQIDIKIGEEKKFDLNDDGIYDLYVKLNGVNNDVPEIYVKRIHEIIPTEKNLEKSSNSETKNNTVDSTDSEKSGTSEINNNSSKESSTLETNNSDFSINNNTNEEIEKNSLVKEDFDDEWNIYLEFISAIDNKDLNKINSLTYTNYSEYFDSYNEEMLWGTIEGMVDAIGQISKTDITDVWKDNKQTILSTAIEESAMGHARNQISFVKSKGIKILLVGNYELISKDDFLDSDKDGRFNSDEDCSANIYTHFPEKCVKTNSNERDTDNDGWWDGIEVIVDTDPNNSSDYLYNNETSEKTYSCKKEGNILKLYENGIVKTTKQDECIDKYSYKKYYCLSDTEYSSILNVFCEKGTICLEGNCTKVFPNTGFINITTNYEGEGATVELDYKTVGKTPFYKELPIGRYHISVSVDGCWDQESSWIDVDADKVTNVSWHIGACS